MAAVGGLRDRCDQLVADLFGMTRPELEALLRRVHERPGDGP
ncbi:hypothetical protein [uncultured Propionibacterium sp.]|nr:hypothetical protein [uncultured Propionibacterium sp.]